MPSIALSTCEGAHFTAPSMPLYGTTDFVHFREGIERLDRELKGEAALETVEGQIGIRLVCDRLGHVKIALTAMDVAGTGNRLSLKFASDQTMSGGLRVQLGSIVRRFPVRRGSSGT